MSRPRGDRGSGRLRCREFAVGLERPLATARGGITEREGFLVGVDAGGTSGVGEAAPLPGWTEAPDACRDALRAASDGPLPGVDTPAARHAVTLAFRDAFARRRGDSVATTLARQGDGRPDPAESVPANATVGDGPVAETVAAAESAVAAGFRTLKVKVGARPLAEDLERIEAVADAVGATPPDAASDGASVGEDADADDATATLRADANGAWDRETATRALRTLEGVVAYVEQPLSAGDLAGHAALRGVGAPVALDESLAACGPFAALAADAADALVLKPMAIGGLERAAAVARAAARRGVDPVVTTTVDAAVARAGAVHLAAAIPGGAERAHGLATGDLLAADVADDPVPVVDGRVAVPDGPGLAGEAFEGLV
ncbi:mandelate racemase/muconate lactonizing enzyme family protein [Halorarum salinum]|uniref:o-succinylbenzoate synthase n=1 Tax=Halorarum salinum TaxID=2743089 RepID=A0A7D5QAX0_9EURY|nr:enolase C-terminal domain-like protein [Halobaculum salinum]QLG62118.1 o-succinylbenzoate synthase [Halobaculum salinum]